MHKQANMHDSYAWASEGFFPEGGKCRIFSDLAIKIF